MTGLELQEFRKTLGLSRHKFGILVGHTESSIYKQEHKELVSEKLEKMILLLREKNDQHLPHRPDNPSKTP